jgi:hypothetical protein
MNLGLPYWRRRWPGAFSEFYHAVDLQPNMIKSDFKLVSFTFWPKTYRMRRSNWLHAQAQRASH